MEHVKSLLPAHKKWRLVWNDEFDGNTLDARKKRHGREQQLPRHRPEDFREGIAGHGGIHDDGPQLSAARRTENHQDSFSVLRSETGCF